MPGVQPCSSPRLTTGFPFLVYALFAAAIPASMLFASFASRRAAAAAPRPSACPSSRASRRPAQQRFTVSFYLTAMLFIVFDIEIVFLYPVAVVLDQVGRFALAEFGFFIGILAIAYVYVWKRGALEWR